MQIIDIDLKMQYQDIYYQILEQILFECHYECAENLEHDIRGINIASILPHFSLCLLKQFRITNSTIY